MFFILLESSRSAMASVLANGFRSILTILGIVIGVASIVAVVSLTEGLRGSIDQQFQSLGANSLTVRSYTSIDDQLKGFVSRLTSQDLDVIDTKVDGISSISPMLFSTRSRQVKYGSQAVFSNVFGTTYAYQNVAQMYVSSGRFLVRSDSERRRRVCVIGSSVHKNLGLPEDPVGEYIDIGGEWFKVVGFLEPKGKLLGYDQDDVILLPYKTMQSLLGAQAQFDIHIELTIADTAEMDTVKERIRSLLRKSRQLAADSPDDFRIQTPEQLSGTIDNIFDIVTAVVGGIVSISLLVGGIGIMNIMLVSVTERTREIGICKAIGAKRHHILLQFIIEALLLSLLGGLVGLLLGYGMGVLIGVMIPSFPPVVVPLWSIVLALGFSGFVGLVFGILPASKAANLDPIDALRFE